MPPMTFNKDGVSLSNVDRAEKIFAEHGAFIRSVIKFNVKNQADAEDLFQDAFLFLISKPISNDVQNTRAFLYRIISDNIKDAFRRIHRYQARIYRYATHQRSIVENKPEDTVIAIEETEKMFELIRKRLPPKEALAVTLRYKDNCDTTKVAEKIGIKPRSVSRYVSVGLKKIRRTLDTGKEGSYGHF